MRHSAQASPKSALTSEVALAGTIARASTVNIRADLGPRLPVQLVHPDMSRMAPASVIALSTDRDTSPVFGQGDGITAEIGGAFTVNV